MVKGASQLHQRFKRVPKLVRDEISAQLEKEATKLVAEMNSIKPLPEIQVGWTWGDAPKGALTIGKVANREYAKVSITIYATSANGSGFSAAWFEFGTAPRFHKSGKSTGQITASPFFWPVYRANKKRIRGNVSRAVTRAMKKA